jgi:hypothetical protein
LLSRAGYGVDASICRLVVSTSPYRMPVNREALQLRRATRLESYRHIPDEPREASAMAHLDVERQTLVNHRTGDQLASVELWCSDPEAQVMSSAESLLSLGEIHQRGELSPPESYLVASIVQTLSNRRIFTVETAVDQSQHQLIAQLEKLQFQVTEQGQRWKKDLA